MLVIAAASILFIIGDCIMPKEDMVVAVVVDVIGKVGISDGAIIAIRCPCSCDCHHAEACAAIIACCCIAMAPSMFGGMAVTLPSGEEVELCEC